MCHCGLNEQNNGHVIARMNDSEDAAISLISQSFKQIAALCIRSTRNDIMVLTWDMGRVT
ncbi:MAG: hypothetical protein BWY14_00035 [Parcubacteria group bacterium ADurb.Bin192]|nr:MAG: hypothetical protein BWY14_00035 [Parcubacteria group bacterium ADurb.Bin192]